MRTRGGAVLRSIGVSCAAAAVALLGTGCATNRGILNVQVGVPPDPAAGRAVTIARVTDCRVFQAAPRDASIPSLKGREIGDKAITSRAIARKRNGYGKAMGDILLPEGRTVEVLTREALTKSFREAGYRVLEGAPAAQEKAVPVEAEIEQFWAWFKPGFWAVGLQFEARVKIKGDLPPLRDGPTVRGHVQLHTQAADTRAWMNTVNKGIEAFVQEVKKFLQSSAPKAGPPA
jgi:hypothetical protein